MQYTCQNLFTTKNYNNLYAVFFQVFINIFLGNLHELRNVRESFNRNI